MKTIFSYRTCASLALLLFAASTTLADTISRDAPAIYSDVIEEELTALEPLLTQVDYFTPEDSNHGCVLQENIVYIDDAGRTYKVYHNAYKVLSNGNLDAIGTDLFNFRPETDKIHVIKAETILPDGRIVPVPPEGMMIQALQQDQDSMIFSGSKQLRLVYPQVSKGSVTHYIVMIEHASSRIPGQYMGRYGWKRTWQTHRKHIVLNLPEDYAKRLNIVVLGDGVPSPIKTTLESGRTRYEWIQDKLPLRKWEYLGGPVDQTGPMLFLSTLKDWNEFAAWYANCVLESSEANDAVKTVAKEWAGDTESEDEIIHNLAFRVANDIRYVSLEFGIGGLQPQPVSKVLEYRFGDCKDKANFLRVLLQEHGIKSYVALINTKHAGHVEKRCPDYHYFNHAILLIEKSDGELLFCDPTVKYGTAGLIYPSIANRPALVIDHETSTGRWVQTPQANAGKLDYTFDLKLTDSGELSGWLTLKATGYYASALSERFEATDRDTLKHEVKRYINYFYDASAIIDYEIKRAEADRQDFYMKTYFIRPVTGQTSQSVSWPSIKWLLPRLGEDKDVQREAFVWNDAAHVMMNLVLPESATLVSVPDDWSVKTYGFEAEGKWSQKDASIEAELNIEVARSHYQPPEFRKLFTAVEATRHWIEEPVILGRDEGQNEAKPAVVTKGRLGEEFVLLSTGEGQLELLDHLYPSNTKAEERRLALEKTKAWFPKDLETQYECNIRLGWLAYMDERYEESLQIARSANREYGDAVDPSTRGWGRYLEAMSLKNLGQLEESQQLFSELEADTSINEFRRGYSAYQYASIMSDQDAGEAVTYYLKALGHDTSDERSMLEDCYDFLLEHMKENELVRFLEETYDREPEKAISISMCLAEIGVDNAGRLLGLLHAAKISQILGSLNFAVVAIGPQQSDQLATLDREFKSYQIGRTKLQEFLENHSYGFWKMEPDQERSFDEYAEEISQAIDDNEIESSTRLALWRILYLEPEVEFPEWIWDAARMVDYLYRHDQRDLESLLTFLFDMDQYLPAEEDGTIDLKFTQAESLSREGHVDEALAIYQSLHDQGLETRWWSSLYSRWTDALASAGRIEKAMEIYSFTRSKLKEEEDFLPLCIQGIYTLFETGRKDEALSWIHGVKEACAEMGWENELVDHVTRWLELEDAGLLEDFFKLSGTWWPIWKQAQQAAGLPSNAVVFPVIYSDLEEAGRSLGNAVANGDSAAASLTLERMLVAAKWHPEICQEAQSLTSFLVEHYPEAEDQFYQYGVALNSEAFQLNPTNRYSCRVNTLDALLKSQRYEELMALAETYYKDSQRENDVNMYSRYGALAAINLERSGTEWFGRMEKQLKDPECRVDPYVVNIVSLLYRLENKTSDELTLLKDFVSSYEGNNEQMLNMLKNRLKQLQAKMESNEQLTAALKDWVEAHAPTWLSCFPDPDLGKEDVADIASEVKLLLGRDDSTTYRDSVYLLHAALDARLDSSTREDAFFRFLVVAMGPQWNSRDDLNRLTAIISDKRYSDTMRNLCASFALNMALSVHVDGYLEESLLPKLDGLEINKEIAKNHDRLVALCNLDAFSPQEVSQWMDSIIDSRKPIDHRMVFLLGSCFHDLCRIGATELAQQQIANVRKLKFDSSAKGSAFTLQLEWQQKLDRVKEMMPLHEVMQEFFMEKLKPDCEKPAYSDVMFSMMLDIEKQQARNRALLQHELYEHMALGFWSDLNNSEYFNGNICVDASNLGPLFAKLLDVCKTDRQYNMAIYLIRQMFDTDDPRCIEIFNSQTVELLRRPELRETHESILWYQYQQRIRSGEQDPLLADLRNDKQLSKMQLHTLMMTLLMASYDRDAISNYLKTASPDLLLAEDEIGNTMRAYRMCGNESGFELLKERGEENLYEFMASAIASGDRVSIYHAIQLADLLGKLDSLNEQWVNNVEKTAQKDEVFYLEMRLADLHEDWPAAESAARSLAAMAPLHYDTYFYLGKALIKQGKHAEGIKALEPFLRYCKDSINYRTARQLEDDSKSRI